MLWNLLQTRSKNTADVTEREKGRAREREARGGGGRGGQEKMRGREAMETIFLIHLIA